MTKKKGKGKGKTVREESPRREEEVTAIASSSQQLVSSEEEFPSLGGVGGGQSTSGQSEKPLASKSKAAAKIQPSRIQSGPSTSSVGESVGQSGGQGDDGAVGGDTQPPLSTDDKGKGKKGPPASGSKSDDLAEQFKRFGIKEKFVARPGIGKAGKVVPLIVNYYKLTVKPFEILHYDVVVESLSPVKAGEKATGLGQSEKTKKIKAMDLNHEIFKSLVDNNPVFRGVRPVYDGQKSLYSSQELNIGRDEWRGVTVLTGNGRTEGERFAVTIKYASNIIVDPKRVPEEKAIQALEILFRYGPRFAPQPKICLRSLVFGQEYLKGRDLGKNMKLAYGYYGSVKSTRSGLAINIDRAATVFYGGGPLIDVMRKIVNIRPPFIMGDYERSQLEAALKGLKVEVLHLPYRRKFTIHLLTVKTASELTFENEGKLVSVKQYFESKYASFFRKPRSDVNPNLPCIKTTNGKYLPMEVCQILPHQRRPGKLPDDIIAEMTRQSAMMKPVGRFASIQNSRDIVVQDGANYLQQFGVSVDPKPMKITGRVLPLPQLQNKRGGAVEPVKP